MLSRLLAPLAATCALAALAPAGAGAASTVTLEPLASVPSGIAIRNTHVNVVQPAAKLLTDLRPDTGARFRELPLPGDAGAATVASAGPGGLWVGIGPTTDQGFAVVDDSEPAFAVHRVPDGATFGCPTTSIAWDAAHAHVVYATTQSPDGPLCGLHGLAIADRDGTTTFVDRSFDTISDLFVTAGHLLLLDHDNHQLRRFALGADSLTPEADLPLPAGGDPSGLTLGPDGQVWVTLRATGQIVEVPVGAPDGTAPRVVAGGLNRPAAIAGTTNGGAVLGQDATYVATADGLERFLPGGARKAIALPAGFAPGALVAQGRDIWVLDTAAPRAAHVVFGTAPSMPGQVDLSGTTASVAVDPAGSDTRVTFIAEGRYPAPGLTGFDAGTVPAGQPRTVSASLATLPPGEYSIIAHAENEDGVTETIVHLGYSVPAPLLPPAPPVKQATPAARKKRPTLADLVSVASTKRCLPTRTLRLTLRKRARGAATVTRLAVAVGRGKRKTYNKAQLKRALTLRGLPAQGRVTVKVTATLSDRTTVTQTLAYQRCAAKRHRR
jgi:hypothetical protein